MRVAYEGKEGEDAGEEDLSFGGRNELRAYIEPTTNRGREGANDAGGCWHSLHKNTEPQEEEAEPLVKKDVAMSVQREKVMSNL